MFVLQFIRTRNYICFEKRSKILTKMKLCSEHILTFYILNEYIFIVKCGCDDVQMLRK